LILSFPLLSHGETIDRIVAIVNEDIVTLFDLNQILRPYENRIRSLGYPFEKEKEMLNKIRQDAVNQLVDQALADQEIKRLDISVSEKEIDQSIERVKEVNDYTEEDLEKTLKKEGITKEEFRKRIKDEILRTKLVNRQVKSKIVITKEDVESYYKAHPEIYGVKKSYRLRHILRRALRESDPESGKKVLKEMEDILTRLKQGDRFEDLAKKHSMMSAAEGGDLGVLDADDLSLQLQESLKGKKAGEFTEILDTDLGYQIVYIEEILQKPGKSMPEATEEIEEKLFREEVEKKYREWLKELRKKSHIKIIDS
jgi:peptidyl-prolyl cis-trans isomerase SurA